VSYRFGVVLVNYNGWDDTAECLESLAKTPTKFRDIVVVDNASKDNLVDVYRTRFPDVHWIRSETNTGWSGGNNQGIQFFLRAEKQLDAIFLLNNDTVVAPDIFEVMEAGFEKGFDILGPVINEYHDRCKIQTQGVAFNRAENPFEFFTVIPTPIDENGIKVIHVDIVNGCAVAIRPSVFAEIGLIDDRFFLICEESDLCLRAIEAGFNSGVVCRSLVWHKHSVSFVKAGKPIQRYYSVRNLLLLLCKHPGGAGRKGWKGSRLSYLRFAYHLYCHELDRSNRPAARSVCEGVADGILGRYGQQDLRNSYFGWWIALFFTVINAIKRGTSVLGKAGR
jgi:GT2 family glycosyltransferase